VESTRSQFFGEPELLVVVLARCLGAVAESRVRKVTVRGKQLHSLSIVTDGGVCCRLHRRCTQLVNKINEGPETLQLLVRVPTLGVTFERLGGNLREELAHTARSSEPMTLVKAMPKIGDQSQLS